MFAFFLNHNFLGVDHISST